jgi:hypothetical protein
LSPAMRAVGAERFGDEVEVRGYQTKDKSCSPTCRLQGRDVSLANGERFFHTVVPDRPDCNIDQLRDYSCPGSEKVSPIPTPPSRKAIAAAMVKAGKRPSQIVTRSSELGIRP